MVTGTDKRQILLFEHVELLGECKDCYETSFRYITVNRTIYRGGFYKRKTSHAGLFK